MSVAVVVRNEKLKFTLQAPRFELVKLTLSHIRGSRLKLH